MVRIGVRQEYVGDKRAILSIQTLLQIVKEKFIVPRRITDIDHDSFARLPDEEHIGAAEASLPWVLASDHDDTFAQLLPSELGDSLIHLK